MRRLAIIDVAGSQQPVYNEDRTVAAVFNGEIYNFGELRAHLRARGHTLTTNGDSECLVHLYEDYGDDLVHHLRGMFAFAIWDAANRRLLLARDRVGKKPLYWRDSGTSLSFGSELKSLLADPAVPRRVDPVALHHYLTYQYVPAPWSIYDGIQKLPPGHVLSWQDGVTKVSRYWRLDCTERSVASIPEAAEQLRDLLLDATRVRMVSERPLGAFLSGGIDSSAVVAAMARQTSHPINTFSIGFEENRFDERAHARSLAEYYGTNHHEFVVTPTALDILSTLAWHFDEPFADSSAIPSFYVAKMSSQHVTVVLTGDGGDESFGGYERYVVMNATGRFPVPRFARRRLGDLGSFIVGHSEARLIAEVGRPGRGDARGAGATPLRAAHVLLHTRAEACALLGRAARPACSRGQLRVAGRGFRSVPRPVRCRPADGRGRPDIPARRSAGQGGHHHDGLLPGGAVTVPRPASNGMGGRACRAASRSGRGPRNSCSSTR